MLGHVETSLTLLLPRHLSELAVDKAALTIVTHKVYSDSDILVPVPEAGKSYDIAQAK